MRQQELLSDQLRILILVVALNSKNTLIAPVTGAEKNWLHLFRCQRLDMTSLQSWKAPQ